MTSQAALRKQRMEDYERCMREATERRAHFVYRCYDVEGILLYIGCTQDVNGRLGVHQSSWSNPASAALNLRMVRHTSERHSTKSAARKAEREAIYNEAPLLNLHHQKVRRAAAERRIAIEDYLQATQPPIDAQLVSAALAGFFA